MTTPGCWARAMRNDVLLRRCLQLASVSGLGVLVWLARDGWPVTLGQGWRWGAALVALFAFVIGSVLLTADWADGRCEEKQWQLLVGLTVCLLVAVPFLCLVPDPRACAWGWVGVVAVYLLLLGLLGGPSHVLEWGLLASVLSVVAAEVVSLLLTIAAVRQAT